MMTKPAAELLKKIIKFGQENAKAVKDSELAQKWRRQLTGKRLAAKLRGVNWKIAGAVLILGAAAEAAYLGDKLADRYNEKHYKPKLIDFPESGAEDGETVDWSRCPEAFQPDENGRFPEEKGQFKLVKKSGEKAVRAAAAPKAAGRKIPAPQAEVGKKDLKRQSEALAKARGTAAEEKVSPLQKEALDNGVSADVFKHNLQVINACKRISLLSLIYFEDFSDEPYLDSAGVPTIAYGLCVYPNGKRVTMKDRAVSRTLPAELIAEHGKNKEAMFAKGRQMSESYMDNWVYGSMLTHIKVKLNPGQAAAIASFVYNLGQPTFEKSTFLKKLNRKDKNCFAEMTLYNACAGKWNQGLQVRRGIEYLIATGKIKPEELLNFRASGGYDKENLSLLFDKDKLQKTPGKINLPQSSPAAVARFIKSQQRPGLKVKNIMDFKTVKQVSAEQVQLAALKGDIRGA